MTDQLRDRIAAAARTVQLRLGPNALAIATGGGTVPLSGGEAYDVADAVLAEVQPELDRQAAELADARAAKRTAAASADRFRDVLSEALGHPDENPGDDTLVAELRQHFGQSGPEPTRWRDYVTSVEVWAGAHGLLATPTTEEP